MKLIYDGQRPEIYIPVLRNAKIKSGQEFSAPDYLVPSLLTNEGIRVVEEKKISAPERAAGEPEAKKAKAPEKKKGVKEE